MLPFDEICTFIVPFVTTESEAPKPRWLFCGGMQQAECLFSELMWSWCSIPWCALSHVFARVGLRVHALKYFKMVASHSRLSALRAVWLSQALPGRPRRTCWTLRNCAWPSILYLSSIFSSYVSYVSSCFIAFPTWCKAAMIQGTVLQVFCSKAVRVNHYESSKDGTIGKVSSQERDACKRDWLDNGLGWTARIQKGCKARTQGLNEGLCQIVLHFRIWRMARQECKRLHWSHDTADPLGKANSKQTWHDFQCWLPWLEARNWMKLIAPECQESRLCIRDAYGCNRFHIYAVLVLIMFDDC